MIRLLLIGGGGHCRSCIDVIRMTKQYEIIGIVDVKEKVGQQLDGVDIIGTDDDLTKILPKTDEVLVTVGKLGRSEKRKKLYLNVQRLGGKFATVISPRSYVSPTAHVSAGTIVMHDACIDPGVKVAENCIINTKGLLVHDSLIGAHTHVSTRVTINGVAEVGANVFIGSHAVVFNHCRIGDNAVIGGGLIVKTDVLANTRLLS